MHRHHRDHPRPPAVQPTEPTGEDTASRPILSRRRFLTTAAVAGGAAAVAGCSIPILSRSNDNASAPASSTSTSSAAKSSTSSSTSRAPTSSAAAPTTSTSTAAATSAGEDIFGNTSSAHLSITVANGYRTIKTASYPDWAVDTNFRYPGTPSPQDFEFKVTTTPQIASKPTQVRTGQVFGIHRNGVVFDPATAEYYGGHDQMGEWNANALAKQLDSHGAHTRPDGFYHLHMIKEAWVSDPTVHSTFMGWAADGYPIYLRYGYAKADDPTSGVKNLSSSYRLKSGARPTGSSSPGGTYDGTYVADYEYVEGLGDLDECNGRADCVTPEYPDGTYAYFLTDQWPYVPHWIRGTPDTTFRPGFGGGSGPMGKKPS